TSSRDASTIDSEVACRSGASMIKRWAVAQPRRVRGASRPRAARIRPAPPRGAAASAAARAHAGSRRHRSPRCAPAAPAARSPPRGGAPRAGRPRPAASRRPGTPSDPPLVAADARARRVRSHQGRPLDRPPGSRSRAKLRRVRHAILGAGGVGLLVGGALARAGADVLLLLRPETLEAFDGTIRVESAVLG